MIARVWTSRRPGAAVQTVQHTVGDSQKQVKSCEAQPYPLSRGGVTLTVEWPVWV